MKTKFIFYDKNRRVDSSPIKRKIFFILISLTIFQQMPGIKELFYNQIRLVLYFVFGVFSIASLLSINKFLKYNIIRYFILTISCSLLLLVVDKLFGNNSVNVFELVVPFGILLCSLNTDYNSIQLKKLLDWYVILTLILAISSIFYYGEGFKILSNYIMSDKNQIGPLIGIAIVISALWIFNKEKFNIKNFSLCLRIGVFFLLVISLFVIRNRSGIVGIAMTLFLYLIVEFKFKKTIQNLFFIQIAMIILILGSYCGLFNSLIASIRDTLFLNYNTNDLNSISAGRTDVYMISLRFIAEHPLLGNMGAPKLLDLNPHNYLIKKWFEYGILGSLPFVALYIYIWIFVLKGIFITNTRTNFSLPLWILLFSLIVSIFEYSYPYGPGVTQLMVWFILGQYLKHVDKEN